MNRKSLAFSVTLGLGFGLFACQDQGVVVPEDDVISPEDLVVAYAPDCSNPKFADHPACPGGGEDPTDEPTLSYDGVFSGTAEEGVSWNIKKGIFGAFVDEGYISVGVNVESLGGPFEMTDCRVWPEGAEEAAQPLLAALNSGQLTGIRTNARVDMAVASTNSDPGDPSADNRIFVFHGGDLGVRYFWIGSWYETNDGTEATTDARVMGFENDETEARWTLVGGAIGLRDGGSPKDAVKLHCPNGGEVSVTLTKG